MLDLLKIYGHCIAQLWIPSQFLPAVYDHIPSTFAHFSRPAPQDSQGPAEAPCGGWEPQAAAMLGEENAFTSPFAAFGSVHRISAIFSGILDFFLA